MADTIRARVVVHGRVQGVFFRDTCQRLAAGTGVAGWIRNRNDGTVEAVFEGDRAAVDRMVTWCHEGPTGARVDRIEIHDEAPEGDHSFRVAGWD